MAGGLLSYGANNPDIVGSRCVRADSPTWAALLVTTGLSSTKSPSTRSSTARSEPLAQYTQYI